MSGHLSWYNKTFRHYIPESEVKQLMQKSNFKGFMEIVDTWGWIVAAFSIVYFFPNPLIVIIALFIIGGKQLGCAIIMHDCSHNAYFTSKKLNDFFGNWFGAYPIFHDLKKYRPYHHRHHVHTGLEEDPDTPLTKGYPTSKISLMRKFARDLFGITGLKGLAGVILMQSGYFEYELNGQTHRKDNSQLSFGQKVKNAILSLYGPLFANLIIFLICFAIGKPILYLLWIGALATTYNFSLRVRSMAEHSMVADFSNPQQNTRTIYASFIERLLFAPHYVNFHSEHHLNMGIPPYNLPQFHRLLKERGYYTNGGTLANNYWEIIQLAIKK